jgi:hypothetical protein
MFFFFSLLSSAKSENRRAEQVLSRGKSWQQWEGVGGKEKGWEGECSAKNLSTYM